MINGIIGDSRPGSTVPGSPAGGRASRPTSVVSAGQLSNKSNENEASTSYNATADQGTQTLSIAPLATVFEFDADAPKEEEVITYSKGVQTSDTWTPPRRRGTEGSDSERDDSPTRSPKASKRWSRRQQQRDEEIRMALKKEIEEELRASHAALEGGAVGGPVKENFPARTLSNEELNAVQNSDDFLHFVERSTKVLERALEQEYDILADYAVGGHDVDEEDEGYGSAGGKKGRRIKEVAQFWDERWSKKRMISDLGFSTKV